MMATQQNADFGSFQPFVVKVKCTDGAVRRALLQVTQGLACLDMTPDEAAAVELVMAETLNNVAEHAYPPGIVPGPIRIICAHEEDGLYVTVIDRGLAMPDGRAPLGAPQCVEAELADLPEGGFGWFLIRSLTQDLRYDRVGHENRLRFRMPIGGVSDG